MFKEKTKSSVYPMPLVKGTIHPCVISKTVAKGTLRGPNAVEGGDQGGDQGGDRMLWRVVTRVALVSVRKPSGSSGSLRV